MLFRSHSRISGRKTSITLRLNDLASIISNAKDSNRNLGKLESIDSERGVFNDVRDQLLKVQSERDLVDNEEYVDDQDGVLMDIEDRKDDETKEKEIEIVMKTKNEEIEKLKNENKVLVETHLEIQKTLKSQLEKRDKEITEKKARISNLREQKRTLEMRIAKKSCNLVPWCK